MKGISGDDTGTDYGRDLSRRFAGPASHSFGYGRRLPLAGNAVTGGQQLCVQAAIKWTSRFRTVRRAGDDCQWRFPGRILGDRDVMFGTTPVSTTDTGWQSLSEPWPFRRTSPLCGGLASSGRRHQGRLRSRLLRRPVHCQWRVRRYDSAVPAGLAVRHRRLDGPGANRPRWLPTRPRRTVQQSSPRRTGIGGDFFSPVIGVTGGQDYCVQAAIRWVGGGAPFVGSS